MHPTKYEVPEISKERQEGLINEQGLKIEESKRMRKLETSSRKLEMSKENFNQRWAQ